MVAKQQLAERPDGQRPTGDAVVYSFGTYQFDPATRELCRNDRTQALSSKPARLLALLLENAPHPVSRDVLAAALWGNRNYADFDDRLNHLVARLRRSLADSAEHPHYIQTSHGLGYKMIAPVTAIDSEGPSQLSPNAVGQTNPRILSRLAAWATAALAAGLATAAVIALRTDPAVQRDVTRPRLSIATPLNLTFDPAFERVGESFGRRLKSEFSAIGSVDLTVPANADYHLRTGFYGGQEPGSLRLAAVLDSGGKERSLWTDQVGRGKLQTDEFQAAAVRAIATRVLRDLLPDEGTRLAMTQAVDAETGRMQIAGREALRAGLLAEAIEHFNSITEREPNNALAHSDLARALIHKGWYTAVRSTDLVPRAKAAALAALELDPSLAEPYLALANTAAFYDWDWAAADRLYRMAIYRNPGHPASYLDYAAYLFVTGRLDDGMEQLEQAELIDPMSASTHGQIGILYHYLRRWEDAHRHYDAALVLEPRNVIWRMHKGCTYIFQGELERGATIIRELRADNPESPMPLVIEAYYYAVIGDLENTQRLLSSLEAAELPPLTELMRASIFVAMGQEREAVRMLRDSHDSRLLSLPLTAIHPTHDPLRTRDDYRALLADLGLEWSSNERLATSSGTGDSGRIITGIPVH